MIDKWLVEQGLVGIAKKTKITKSHQGGMWHRRKKSSKFTILVETG